VYSAHRCDLFLYFVLCLAGNVTELPFVLKVTQVPTSILRDGHCHWKGAGVRTDMKPIPDSTAPISAFSGRQGMLFAHCMGLCSTTGLFPCQGQSQLPPSLFCVLGLESRIFELITKENLKLCLQLFLHVSFHILSGSISLALLCYIGVFLATT
jgi:hypothetical protein